MTRPRHAPHAPRTPFLLLVLGLLGAGLVLLLALNTASAANEVQRHDLARQDASVSALVAQLKVEVADSAAPGNLAAIAAQLGMVPAGNPAFLQIGPDGTVRVLGSPAAASAAPLPPPPTRTATKAATRTATKAATAAATKTPTSTATSTAKTPPASGTRTAPRPAPTPTPTPTIPLPGGTR